MSEPIEQPPAPALDDLLAEQQTMARDQLTAAWQLHVEQVQAQLEQGWRDQIARVVEERFGALPPLVAAAVERRAEERLAEFTARQNEEMGRARGHARRQMSERLNQAIRRLDQAENKDAWIAALLDGAQSFAPRVLLFSLAGGALHFEGYRAGEAHSLGEVAAFDIPLKNAPAVNGVAETLDTVICLRSAGELGTEIAALVGEDTSHRVCLLPLVAGRNEPQRKLAGVLYAESGGEPLDVNVLELLCSTASLSHDCRLMMQKAAAAPKAGAILSIAPASPAVAEPDWNRLSREEQELHLKAQRFARVRVAEMRLYMSQQVKEGRAQKRLYLALRGEMDRGRAQFQHEYLHQAGMADYFHQEILHTLANDDPSLLGPEYPGPLA